MVEIAYFVIPTCSGFICCGGKQRKLARKNFDLFVPNYCQTCQNESVCSNMVWVSTTTAQSFNVFVMGPTPADTQSSRRLNNFGGSVVAVCIHSYLLTNVIVLCIQCLYPIKQRIPLFSQSQTVQENVLNG